MSLKRPRCFHQSIARQALSPHLFSRSRNQINGPGCYSLNKVGLWSRPTRCHVQEQRADQHCSRRPCARLHPGPRFIRCPGTTCIHGLHRHRHLMSSCFCAAPMHCRGGDTEHVCPVHTLQPSVSSRQLPPPNSTPVRMSLSSRRIRIIERRRRSRAHSSSRVKVASLTH